MTQTHRERVRAVLSFPENVAAAFDAAESYTRDT